MVQKNGPKNSPKNSPIVQGSIGLVQSLPYADAEFIKGKRKREPDRYKVTSKWNNIIKKFLKNHTI